jgi:glucokinase-like ROK family protein
MRRRYRTGDQNWVRERNLAIVLNYLWEAGKPISRTHLTEISGLNKSTIGSLLTQLQTWGFVRESGITGQRPGRPGVMIDLNPDAGRLIGVEIGVGFISVIVTDLKANVVWRCNAETTDQDQAQVLDRAMSQVDEAARQVQASGHRLFGIGLGVPGLVDHTSGTLLFAPNLGWSDIPLRDMWRRRFGVPVVVENEANAAALGERMLGVGRQVDNFVYLSAGVGLGSGLMIDGRLYGGVGGFAGEIGHMTIDLDGPQCKCGNRGCWETLIGPIAMVQRARQAAAEGRAPRLLALCEVGGDVNTLQMEHVLRAASEGEQAILDDLDEVGRYLGIGIANLINAFNPSLVVLGGMLSLAGPYILPRAHQEVDARALSAAREGVRLTVSAFKFDACVMGGVSLIVREILSNPASWQPRPETSHSPDDLSAYTAGAF